MNKEIKAEPFKIKAVEPINLISREEREKALERAGYYLWRYWIIT